MIVVQDAKKRYRDFELDVSLEVPEGRKTEPGKAPQLK